MTVGVRKPSVRGRRRLVGLWPSLKADGSMWWESSLEHDELALNEWDPDVKRFLTQPMTIAYTDGRTRRRYTPDLLVERTDGLHVIEVKYARDAEDPEFQRLARLKAAAFADLNYCFEVRTERVIRRQPRLANVRVLLRYQREDVPLGLRFELQDLVRARPGVCLSDVTAWIGGHPRALALTYALLATHAVAYDIDAVLDGSLSLYPKL